MGFSTVERGIDEEITEAVEKSMSALGPKGFVLSLVDNVTDNSKETWDNIETMIRIWKEIMSRR